MTEVKGEVEAKAAAKGMEQEGSSLRADCSLCSPAVQPDGGRLALTGVCVPDRGNEEDDKITQFCQQRSIWKKQYGNLSSVSSTEIIIIKKKFTNSFYDYRFRTQKWTS